VRVAAPIIVGGVVVSGANSAARAGRGLQVLARS
jgi:hypothetical protein